MFAVSLPVAHDFFTNGIIAGFRPSHVTDGLWIDDALEIHVFFHDNIVLWNSIKESVWLRPGITLKIKTWDLLSDEPRQTIVFEG